MRSGAFCPHLARIAQARGGSPDRWGAAGNYVLAAGSPVGITATIERGDVRCDYPPGDWNIQVALIPAIGGEPGDRVYLPDVLIPIPFQETVPLEYVASRETRFCSCK